MCGVLGLGCLIFSIPSPTVRPNKYELFYLTVARLQECAIKFFTHLGAFERERELYAGDDAGLKQMMAAVKHLEANRDGEFLMAPGHPFPPCIVVEVRCLCCLVSSRCRCWRCCGQGCYVFGTVESNLICLVRVVCLFVPLLQILKLQARQRPWKETKALVCSFVVSLQC